MFAAAPAASRGFGRRKKSWRDIDLVVDLAEEPLSLRWWRGVATLSALCALVAVIAPTPFEPLPAVSPDLVGAADAVEFRDIAISPLAEGSRTGRRMDANALVQPLSEAPDRPFIELFAKLGSGDNMIATATFRPNSGVGTAWKTSLTGISKPSSRWVGMTYLPASSC